MDTHIRLGDEVEIDSQTLSGRRGEESLALPGVKLRSCNTLANSERAVSREELLNKVWGYAKGLDLETRTVDIHIAKLRRKIEPDAKTPCFLTTVRGAGYRLLTD